MIVFSLYNAIIKRVRELEEKSPTMKELRSQTAEFLRNNLVEFLPYLSHPDTGNMLTESQYAEYCDQVADKAWGGQIEVRTVCSNVRFFHTIVRV
jgi:OTU domain-containing protein 6